MANSETPKIEVFSNIKKGQVIWTEEIGLCILSALGLINLETGDTKPTPPPEELVALYPNAAVVTHVKS